MLECDLKVWDAIVSVLSWRNIQGWSQLSQILDQSAIRVGNDGSIHWIRVCDEQAYSS